MRATYDGMAHLCQQANGVLREILDREELPETMRRDLNLAYRTIDKVSLDLSVAIDPPETS